jgi:hypothetical protein
VASEELVARESWWLLFPEGPIAAILVVIAPAWAISLALQSHYAKAALVLIGTWGLAYVAIRGLLAERKGVVYAAVVGILAIAGFVSGVFA